MQAVSATIHVPDKIRVPMSKTREQAFAKARKNATRKRWINYNTKYSKERCDSLLKKF